MNLDIIQQRAELVQELIDRQIYLPPDRKEDYLKEFKKLNERFTIKKRIVHGMHIIEQ